MKKIYAIILVLLLAFGSFGLFACDIEIGQTDDDQLNPNVETIINYWGWGDPQEIEITQEIVKQFNATNPYGITVKYTPKPVNGYVGMMEQTLGGSRVPDVFYVGDGEVKKWSKLNHLAPLDEYVDKSEVLDLEDIYDSPVQRFRFDKASNRSRPGDPLYAFPRYMGPTVLYYNADQLKSVGITIVSKDLSDSTITESEKRGFNLQKKIFNNRIPMTWDEIEELSKLLTKSHNGASPSDYGYYTEWWFNYGWSVGGDCLGYDEANKKFIFTLGDKTQKTNAKGELMPSQFDAFKRFVYLSQGRDLGGLAITPKATDVASVGKLNYFTSGKVAMMVEGRGAVANFREYANFDWDVAPLPKAEKGIEAGHSGCMGLGIWAKSKKKLAAFKFLEYVCGKEGQTILTESGFTVPVQRSLANSDVFLKTEGKPFNNVVFTRAAEFQTAPDWTYLPDSAWIAEWAPTLNTAVRDGSMSLDEFFNVVTDKTNKRLLNYS